MAESEFEDLSAALTAIEDLIGILQDLKHRIETVEDFDAYGVIDSLVGHIEETLERYDSLD